MYNTVDCPYCGCENDMTDAIGYGLSEDNTIDWTCQECEEEFEVLVEFDPCYTASKIEYIECGLCHKSAREIHSKGTTFPFPKKYEDKKLCDDCFCMAMGEEYKEEEI